MKKPCFQKFYFKIFIILLLTIIFLITLQIHAETQPNQAYAIINNTKIILEVADTEEAKATGLMYRDFLGEKNGLIFLFSPPEKVDFWMKNVKIPLDIVFIYNNKVVKIDSEVPVCKKDPCKIYSSGIEIDYVIELNSGFCKKYGVKINQSVFLNKNLYKKSIIN